MALNQRLRTIQLPADISAALGARWDDVPRRSLEAIAIEGYRTGALTEEQVRRVLALETRFDVHASLTAYHLPPRYSAAELDEDLDAQHALGILPGHRPSQASELTMNKGCGTSTSFAAVFSRRPLSSVARTSKESSMFKVVRIRIRMPVRCRHRKPTRPLQVAHPSPSRRGAVPIHPPTPASGVTAT